MLAIGLTLAVAVVVLVAFSLVLAGPALAQKLGTATGWGAPFESALARVRGTRDAAAVGVTDRESSSGVPAGVTEDRRKRG